MYTCAPQLEVFLKSGAGYLSSETQKIETYVNEDIEDAPDFYTETKEFLDTFSSEEPQLIQHPLYVENTEKPPTESELPLSKEQIEQNPSDEKKGTEGLINIPSVP